MFHEVMTAFDASGVDQRSYQAPTTRKLLLDALQQFQTAYQNNQRLNVYKSMRTS